ncbi:thrombospondin [Actinoplanes sp. NPDC051475]|uniref:thrombospondin n=1 Tax=Actinoplanes sp. NPDC051475 TaxID=3157225 RepID=UPI00344CD283
MRLPTFSRQSDTTTTETEDRAPVSARTDAPTQPGAVQAGRPEDLAAADRAAEDRTAANRTAAAGAIREQDARTEELRTERARTEKRHADDRDRTLPMAAVDDDKTRHANREVDSTPDRVADRTPEPLAGPKPRASLLATLGLITGLAGALLVLSGPLLGYGIGVAGLALILSVAGIRATNKRHVAGKTDALIGMVLALAAIVVGVLALTGSLSWLGTDMQPVSSLREWLDTQFVNRF